MENITWQEEGNTFEVIIDSEKERAICVLNGNKIKEYMGDKAAVRFLKRRRKSDEEYYTDLVERLGEALDCEPSKHFDAREILGNVSGVLTSALATRKLDIAMQDALDKYGK